MHGGLTTVPHCGRIEVVGAGPNNTGEHTQDRSGVAGGEGWLISPRPVFSKRTQSAVRRAEACQVRAKAPVGWTVRLHTGRQNRQKDTEQGRDQRQQSAFMQERTIGVRHNQAPPIYGLVSC